MNKTNIIETKTVKDPVKMQTERNKKPNDTVGFYFSSSIKITDPNSGEVLLHKRCD
jgi:hypothetical protein